MPKLLFATTNRGKVRELLELFADSNVEIITLDQLEHRPEEPDETGSTFEANALLKAAYYAKATNLPCIADDSGLEVDALDKRPGVYSARYVEGSDADRNQKILQEMEGKENRSARFVSVIAYAIPSGESQTFRGTCEGRIADASIGDQGFGYDPIFIPQGYDQTFALLGNAIKNTLSHRFKAMNAFSEWHKNNGE